MLFEHYLPKTFHPIVNFIPVRPPLGSDFGIGQFTFLGNLSGAGDSLGFVHPIKKGHGVILVGISGEFFLSQV